MERGRGDLTMTTTNEQGAEMTITTISAMAIRAAKNRRAWGRDATMRYLAKRGVPVRLYQIAMACEATANGEFLGCGGDES